MMAAEQADHHMRRQRPLQTEEPVVFSREQDKAEFLHRLGYLVAHVYTDHGLFVVDDLGVANEDDRRRGLGALLLSEAKAYAESLPDIDTVMAIINSREGYQVTRRVFGEQHIKVDRLGDYEDPDPGSPPAPDSFTLAVLRYPTT